MVVIGHPCLVRLASKRPIIRLHLFPSISNFLGLPCEAVGWTIVLFLACGWVGTANAQNAYVTNVNDGTVSVIDVGTGQVTATFAAGSEAEGASVSPDGRRLYVGNDLSASAGSITVIDTAVHDVVTTISSTGGRTPLMSPDGSKIYFPHPLSGNISVVSTATNTVVGTISTPLYINGIAVSPDGTKLYAANELLGTLVTYSTVTGAQIGSVSVGATSAPTAMRLSPDGTTAYVLLYNENSVSVIGTASQSIVTTIAVGKGSNPEIDGMALTPDGRKLYVTNTTDGTVSVIDTTTDVVIATVAVGRLPVGVTVTPDGSRAYVANAQDNTISIIDTVTQAVTGAPITVGKTPTSIVFGTKPPAPPLAAAILPGSRSVQTGHPATVFATVLNTGASALPGCNVSLPTTASFGLALTYQTTDPATNAVTGLANQPFTIPANGSQSLVLTLRDSFSVTDAGQSLLFTCGTVTAPIVTGVDTVDLSVSLAATPDIVALGATTSGDGILALPGVNGAGAFAIATANVGTASSIVATADTGSGGLPLNLSICQTNPTTGACMGTAGSSASTAIPANGTPTFSVFAIATSPIPFVPENNRIFVRFKDLAGNLRGSTSVAVRTQ